MISHQSDHIVLSVPVNETLRSTLHQNEAAPTEPQVSLVPISPVIIAPSRRLSHHHLNQTLQQQHHHHHHNHPAEQHQLVGQSKLAPKRGHQKQANTYHHHQHLIHNQLNSTRRQQSLISVNRRSKKILAREYESLRQVVPSLRRQRDVDKVELVTEAARYIDHLHKTLIERLILFGIPDSLKDILGTDDASELSSEHITNLVVHMAAEQPLPEFEPQDGSRSGEAPRRTGESLSGRLRAGSRQASSRRPLPGSRTRPPVAGGEQREAGANQLGEHKSKEQHD